jgi:hypothetical protein
MPEFCNLRRRPSVLAHEECPLTGHYISSEGAWAAVAPVDIIRRESSAMSNVRGSMNWLETEGRSSPLSGEKRTSNAQGEDFRF